MESADSDRISNGDEPEPSESWVWTVGFVLAIVFHVAVTTTYSTALRWAEHAASKLEGVAVGALWVLVVIFIRVLWEVRSEKVARRQPWKVVTSAWPWMVATLAGLTTIATGTALHEWLYAFVTPEPAPRPAYLLGTGVLLASTGFTALLFVNRHAFGARAQYPRGASAEKRRCLVLFVSNLDKKRVGECDHGIPTWHTLATGLLADEFGKLDADKKAYQEKHDKWPANWPWEMSLHGIAHHLGVVDTLALICSTESLRDVHHLKAIIAGFADTASLATRTIVWCRGGGHGKPYGTQEGIRSTAFQPVGFDLEELDDLSDAIRSLLSHLHSLGFEDEDIMLDFTSGQKTNSIVCACVTFNGALRAQYMKTNDPSVAISYDMSVDSDRSPVGG